MNTFEPPIFELAAPGRIGASLPACDVPETPLPTHLLRKDDLNGLPELSETEVIRHFTRISQRNMCIDTTMYPLGSCTIKYNPKINEEAARIPGLAMVHPLQPAELSQGALRLMYELSGESVPARAEDVSLVQLTPAFILNELRVAFQIGFVIFLPFLLIDLVVSSVLLSLGMLMVPPATVSLPLKVLLFVLIDGWSLILRGVIGSFQPA